MGNRDRGFRTLTISKIDIAAIYSRAYNAPVSAYTIRLPPRLRLPNVENLHWGTVDGSTLVSVFHAVEPGIGPRSDITQ